MSVLGLNLSSKLWREWHTVDDQGSCRLGCKHGQETNNYTLQVVRLCDELFKCAIAHALIDGELFLHGVVLSNSKIACRIFYIVVNTLKDCKSFIGTTLL